MTLVVPLGERGWVQVSGEQFADFVKERRVERKLTQQALAEAAHISKSYLVKLESGRLAHPSPRVLEHLARALNLSADESRRLFILAGRVDPSMGIGWNPPLYSPDIHPIYASWVRDDQSATLQRVAVVDMQLHLRQANAMFRSTFPGVGDYPTLAEWQFLDPRARLVHEQWEQASGATVWWLQRELARHPDHADLVAQLARLTDASFDFRRLWASQEKTSPAETMRIRDYGTKRVITLVSACFARQPHDGVYVWVGVPEES